MSDLDENLDSYNPFNFFLDFDNGYKLEEESNRLEQSWEGNNFGIGNFSVNSEQNDFIFDNQMILEIIKHNYKISEIYCPAKYDKNSSSINFVRSVRYGLLILWYSVVYKLKGL